MKEVIKMTKGFMEQAIITVENKNKKDIKSYTRFTLLEGNKPTGEFIIHSLEMISETHYIIEKVVSHSENGIDIEYETTKLIYDGFVKDNIKEILVTVENGGGYVKGRYINVLPPRMLSLKKENVKYIECNEKWFNNGELSLILKKMGEADYDGLKNEIEKGRSVTYRYISENSYKESFSDAGYRIRYIQIFVDGKNFGYTEDHPHREYKKTEDGRTIAIGEPTIYYDILLNAYDLGIHRTNTLNLWIKKP